MDDALRTSIILAAVNAAGPAGDDPAEYDERLKEQVARIAAMCSASSPVAKVVEGVAASKVFAATVVGIVKEQSSTRGKVTLKTKPSKWHEDGIEEARTERTDNGGLPMCRKLRALVGHRVQIWIEVEETDRGKVRVVRHVEDLGADESLDSEPAA